MPITLRQAIDRTLIRLSLATGVDTQTYAEDPLVEIINHKLITLFDAEWWPQYMAGAAITLVNGEPSAVPTGLTSWMDIKNVWIGNRVDPLPRVPSDFNPTLVAFPSLDAPDTAGKIFKIRGTYSETTGYVRYRKRPSYVSADADIIDMDDQLIILGTAFDYLNGLGTNPSEEDKLLQMFNARYGKLVEQFHLRDVSTRDYASNTSSWQELN